MAILTILLLLGQTGPGDIEKDTEKKSPSLNLDAASLRRLPHVQQVTVNAPQQPTHKIIHLLDWHFVSKEKFVADIQDTARKPFSQADLEKKYENFLLRVESVQKEQISLLRHLIKHHRLQAVHLEGLTPKNLPKYRKLVTALRRFKKPKGETIVEQFLLKQYRLDLLRIGAAGRLWVSGELKSILPAEDDKLFEASDPIDEQGKVKFDKRTNEQREDAIVKNLLQSRSVSIIVLGGVHDLSDNLKRFSIACEYFRVRLKSYPR